jgi:hypothetical protein
VSSDLKLGDLCVIVAPASADLIGLDCEIIGEEMEYQRKVLDTPLLECWHYCIGFKVRTSDGRRFAIERICLRKKPPMSDDDRGEPRADFTPAAAEFVEDLQRRLTKHTEPA